MTADHRILIVEDNPEIMTELHEILSREGYRCNSCTDGEQALQAIRRRQPDLVLLDRMLPRLSGDEVARELRSSADTRLIPIIMLTGKADEDDQLVGFALGADDYIQKPFSAKILLARIAAQLRSRKTRKGASPDEYAANSIQLDRSQPRVFVDHTAVPLTSTEYKLLASLMAAGGTVLRAGQLATLVFGGDSDADPDALESEIDLLRHKMGPAAGCIQHVGAGDYAFCPPPAFGPIA